MKIAVIGTRGFPNIQGGVEKHCESLYPLLVEKNDELHLIVFRRKQYVSSKKLKYNNRIRFVDISVIKNKYIETIYHSLAAACLCVFLRPDIVHIHNIGPALVLPLLKLAGIRSVVTYHSDNYNHDKWGPVAKKILKLGERFVSLMADRIIVVSKRQKQLFSNNSNVEVIPNGIYEPTISTSTTYLNTIGVQPFRYMLAVSRFVPEKGLDLLVTAFQAARPDWKLVIAGDADHDTAYSRKLKAMIDADDAIIRTGYITGEPLNQVFTHAGLFVLPSYHEGLPIALLEAMSYGLSVLVSDLLANREVGLAEQRYFKTGDAADLKEKLTHHLTVPITPEEKARFRRWIHEKYNWHKIAEQTIQVYQEL